MFAANALVVGDRNWAARAQVQNGAPLVLETDSRNPTALLAATRAIDPEGASVSPVAVVRRVDASSTPTMAVVTRTVDDDSSNSEAVAWPCPTLLAHELDENGQSVALVRVGNQLRVLRPRAEDPGGAGGAGGAGGSGS